MLWHRNWVLANFVFAKFTQYLKTDTHCKQNLRDSQIYFDQTFLGHTEFKLLLFYCRYSIFFLKRAEIFQYFHRLWERKGFVRVEYVGTHLEYKVEEHVSFYIYAWGDSILFLQNSTWCTVYLVYTNLLFPRSILYLLKRQTKLLMWNKRDSGSWKDWQMYTWTFSLGQPEW